MTADFQQHWIEQNRRFSVFSVRLQTDSRQ